MLNEAWNVAFSILTFHAGQSPAAWRENAEKEWRHLAAVCRAEYGETPAGELMELFTDEGHPHSVFVSDCPDGFQYADFTEMVSENPDMYHSFGVAARVSEGDVRFVNVNRFYDNLEVTVLPERETFEIPLTKDPDEITGVVRRAIEGRDGLSG